MCPRAAPPPSTRSLPSAPSRTGLPTCSARAEEMSQPQGRVSGNAALSIQNAGYAIGPAPTRPPSTIYNRSKEGPKLTRLLLSAMLLVPPLPAQYLRGVNLSGAEFGENQIPGTFNRDYTYNSETSFRYFAAKN